MALPTSSTAKRKQREVIVLSDDDNDDDVITKQPVTKKTKAKNNDGDDLTHLLNDQSDDIIAKQPVPKKAKTNDSGKDDLTHLLNDDDDDLAFHEIPTADDGASSNDTTPEAPPQEGPKEFTVLSWNIDGLEDEYLMERFQGALKDILKKLPTIVMLQEVVYEHYLNLILILSSVYEVRSLMQNGYFNVILFLKKSHVEIIGELDGKFFPSSQMQRHYLSQNIHIYGKNITVMTSHLESLKESAAERQKQLKQCFQMMTDSPCDTNFIFAGDLNMRAEDLKKVGGIPPKITDAWETAGENLNAKFTWDLELNDNKRFPNCKPRARFDRMFFKRSLSTPVQCIGFELVGFERLSCGMFPSDHFGILGKFILPDD